MAISAGAAGSQPVVLALDAAGLACSVAVGVGDMVVGTERDDSTGGQTERFLPMVDRALSGAGLPPGAVDVVAVTVGPGSFTGIRIGLAVAKGIALGADARLIGMTSFDAVAFASPPHNCFLLVALESRRDDLYVQLLDPGCGPVCEPTAVMPLGLADAVNATIGSAPLLIAGDAAQCAAAMLSKRPDTTVLMDSSPDAIGALRAALCYLRRGERSDTVRPLYLRAPDVTLPVEHPKSDFRPA